MSDKIVARLRKVRSMIGAMCHEGRPPKMSIPARPDMDEDIVISDAADDAADLIERLQAEKAEMEKLREQNTALSDALDYLRGLTPQQYEALHKDAKRWRLARTRFIAFDWAWNSPPIPVAIFHMPEVKEVRAGPEGADAAIDAARARTE